MTRKTRLFLSVSVSTAIPTLPVQRSHLQTAAEQTQQGTGRPRHVCISGGYFRPCFSELPIYIGLFGVFGCDMSQV